MLKVNNLVAGLGLVVVSSIWTCICPNGAFAAGQDVTQRGLAYLKNGDAASAAIYLTQAVRLNPSDLAARRYLCQAWLKLNLPDRVISQIQMIQKVDPGKPADAIILGDALYDSGKIPQAQQAYQQALTLDNKCELGYVGMIKVYMQAGSNEKAEQVCNFLLKTSTNPQILSFVSDKLNDLRLNKQQAAVEQVKG